MTIIIGLTGSIASGKTTIAKLLKKKKFAIHDSDKVVNSIYSKPTTRFKNYLKKIKLGNSVKGKKINKLIIREEIFNKAKQKKLLEKYIHNEVKKSRDRFLKKNKKLKIILLDIPLLFEKRLEKICNYTILVYAPLKLRRRRAMKRKGMNKKILEKIINNQLTDKAKKTKSDFVVNTSNNINRSFNKILNIINSIKKNPQCGK